MVFLRSAPVQTILKWCQDGSQHPRFSEGDLLSIPVPDAVSGVSAQTTTIVKESFATRHQSRLLLEVAKRGRRDCARRRGSRRDDLPRSGRSDKLMA